MSDKLVRLGFISISNPPLTDAVISNIKSIADKKNNNLDITGVLYIYKEINLQTFEGPKKNIDQLMNSIKRDPRHQDITLLQEIEIGSRLYPENNVKIIRVKDSDSNMVSHILGIKERHI